MQTAKDERRARIGVWTVLPRALQSAVLVVLVLAVGTEIVTVAVEEPAPQHFVPALLITGAVVTAFRRPSIGLLLAALAPGAAELVERTQITGVWSMACFVAFLLALRGQAALLTGAVLAVTNFAAVAWHLGTIDVNVDASASIAAFAAVVSAAAGSAIRDNHRYRVAVDERMQQAEESRVAAVQHGIGQERLRIARDLHDSVGHQIAVVNMHLGAAEVHLPASADESRDDLAAARAGVQAVLQETQQILAVLRVDDSHTQLTPSTELASLSDLLDSFRAGGMDIDAQIGSDPPSLSAATSAAAYRIVQEALTNAQKHGRGSVSVAIADEPGDRIRIQIVNHRRPGARRARGAGYGIIGMRERAASVGGDLTVHSDDNLFWTTAILPIGSEGMR